MLANITMGIKGTVFIAAACWLFARLLRPEDAKWIRGKPTFLAIFIFAFAAVAYNIWIYNLVLLFLLVWAARNRADAVALYPIALCSLPSLIAYMMAGPMLIAPVDKFLLFATGLAIAIVFKVKKRGTTNASLDVAFLLLFVLTVIQARDLNFSSTLRELTTPVIALAVPYYLVSRNLKTVEDIRRVVLTFTFIGFMLSCIAVIEMKTHWLIYQSMFQMLKVPFGGLSLYLKIRSGLLRAPTSFGESTSFGLFLGFTMMFCLAGRDVFKSRQHWLFAIGVMFLGMVAANTRNAWIALAIGLPVYDLYRRRYASLMTKMGLFVILYGTLLLAAEFSPYVATAIGKSADTSSTADYRRQLLTRGLEEVRKHPWTGVSVDKAVTSLADMRQGEGVVDIVNAYLYFALTAGYLGAVALLGVFMVPLIVLFRRSRSLAYDPRLQRYGGAVVAIAAFSTVTSFFTGFGDKSATFYVITIAIGTAVLSVRRPPRPQPAAEPDVVATEPQLEPA